MRRVVHGLLLGPNFCPFIAELPLIEIPSLITLKGNVMFTIPEQYSDTARAQCEAQISMFNAWTNSAFESMEKIIELNTTAARVSLDESTFMAQQLIQANGPQEFISLATAQARPSAEKAVAYTQHLVTIASGCHAEFSRLLQEQAAQSGRKLSTLLEDFVRAAPTSLDNVNNVLKSVIGNAAAEYDRFSGVAREASDAAGSNVAAAMTQMANDQEKAAARATKH